MEQEVKEEEEEGHDGGEVGAKEEEEEEKQEDLSQTELGSWNKTREVVHVVSLRENIFKRLFVRRLRSVIFCEFSLAETRRSAEFLEQFLQKLRMQSRSAVRMFEGK